MWLTWQYPHLYHGLGHVTIWCGYCIFLGFGKSMQYPSKFQGECKYRKMIQVLHLKFHDFIQVDLLTSMWRTLQYLHFLEPICLASYNEHGIIIIFKYLVSWFMTLLQGLCNTFSNSKRYVMEPKGFMGYPNRSSACELSSYGHE